MTEAERADATENAFIALGICLQFAPKSPPPLSKSGGSATY
jgi:hypothetical protein